jgi:hypothetical protein
LLRDSAAFRTIAINHKQILINALEAYQPNMTAPKWLFLQNALPESNITYYSPPADIKKLAADCVKLGICYPERFADINELKACVKLLNPANPTQPNIEQRDPNKPVALLIFNRADHNGAFEANHISELRAKGYQVLYYEVDLDTEIPAIFEQVGRQRKIDFVEYAGHGSFNSLTLSSQSVFYASTAERKLILAGAKEQFRFRLPNTEVEKMDGDDLIRKSVNYLKQHNLWQYCQVSSDNVAYLTFKDLARETEENPAEVNRVFSTIAKIDTQIDIVALRNEYEKYLAVWSELLIIDNSMLNTIDPGDTQIFMQTPQWCNSGCVVVLFACSNGAGRENNPNNLANFFRKIYAGPDFRVFSADGVAFGTCLEFSGQKIIAVKYGNVGTYEPRNITGAETTQRNFLTSED